MNVTSYIQANQVIPLSRARAELSHLVENIAEKDILVLAKKYQPKAALVDLKFLGKLLTVYTNWKREQDFTQTERLLDAVPNYPAAEVEQDINHALRSIR